jgi:hypothetical protein
MNPDTIVTLSLNSQEFCDDGVRLRKDVNVFLYNPSSRFLNVVVELKNAPGALASVLNLLQEQGVNTLGSFSSVEPSARTGVWSAFVDGSNVSSAELKRKLSSLPSVLDSMIVDSKDGFLVDGVHFPVAWNTGDRALIMRARFIIEMFERIRRRFGTGGRSTVFEEGYAFGQGTWSELIARIGDEFARSNLKDVLSIYQALGWFKIDSVERSAGGGSAKIRVTMNF